MKRRDAIRSLYSATSDSGKLAMANSQPDEEAEQGNQAGAMSADRAPSPGKLATANSRSDEGANPSDRADAALTDRTPSPGRLAMANSQPDEATDGSEQAGAAQTARAPSPEKLAMANSRTPDMSHEGRVLAGPVRAMSLSLNRLDEDRRALQEALVRGETVVDIDPTLIDPSFVKDRLDHDGDSFADFKRLIEERGQEVPILVRPHPDRPGRFQVAYGHRRLRAASELGRQVRAVVRALSDSQLVVAQGLENSARQDLTYIEKALFACRLEDRGFERSIIIDALSTDKGELSKLIAVARAVPESIANRIGPAPKAGRRRWLALAEHLKKAAVARAVEKAVSEDAFASLDSDARFVRVAALAAPRDRSDPASTRWAGQGGQATAQISRKGTSVTLAIDRDPSFGDFVASRLDELYAAFLAQGASQAPREDRSGSGSESRE
ncbi:plasmid partitioning protein RepB [Methylobacterium sp. sgz302541]|uniref:plasmid partitioning protein RepB n=1 Tax=unclassified Methylobacterium TaxID=2615210 RepID=UPI003D33EC5F